MKIVLSVVLCLVLTMLPFAPPVASKTKPVTITFGQPNIWSIEQAHYLLSRVQMLNDGLKGKAPAESDLDPSATHGTSIDILRSIFGVEAGFEQSAMVKNRIEMSNYEVNQTRRAALQAKSDELRAQRLEVVKQLGVLKVEKQKLDADTTATEAARKVKTEEVGAKEAEKTLFDAEIDAADKEIATITSSPPTFSGPTVGGTNQLPTPLLESLLKANPSAPKLHASQVLDNYIQMQYEIIAKQLTLLRDEVGPDERLVFLEIPQSFYTNPDDAKDYVIQTKWIIESVCNEFAAQVAKPADSQGDAQELMSLRNLGVRQLPVGAQSSLESSVLKNNVCKAPREVSSASKPISRAIDIIPRQSALNVTATHSVVKGFNIANKLSLLTGFAAKVDYQRQREHYDQFINQELFASGFGKGGTEFGWTFGPLPGTRVVAPGVRTTYAVLSVPKESLAVQVKVEGRYYKRDKMPSDEIAASQSFFLQIPAIDENTSFYVTGAFYSPVRVGERITVFLKGSRFSPQTGVLINGVPLQRTVGLAQPTLTAQLPNSVADSEIQGQFEYLNQGNIILSFTAGRFTGTPEISLVSPGRATSINGFKLPLHKDRSLDNLAKTAPMFVPPVTVRDLQIVRFSETEVDAYLTGSGFRDGAVVFVDSSEAVARVLSANRLELRFPPSKKSDWRISVRHTINNMEDEATYSVPNPIGPRITSHQILGFWPNNSEDPDSKGRMVVKVQGTGFDPLPKVAATLVAGPPLRPEELSSPLKATAEGAEVVGQDLLSTGELVLTLKTATSPVVVTLANGGLATVFAVEVPKPPKGEKE